MHGLNFSLIMKNTLQMNKEVKKRTTMISEVARQRLGITRDEYALCSYIQYRAADPRQKIGGWCCDSKDEIAEFVVVTRRGLYKLFDRLEAQKLLDLGAAGAIRVTSKWIDTEQECKQSSQQAQAESVNKVHSECEQSSHRSVNKVPDSIIIKVKEEISKSKDDYGKAADVENVSSTFNAEKKNTPPQIAPPPPPPSPFRPLDIAAEIERLEADDLVKENFQRRVKLPVSMLGVYVKDFSLHIQTLQKKYSNVTEFRSHFFNYCDTHKKKSADGPTLPRANPHDTMRRL